MLMKIHRISLPLLLCTGPNHVKATSGIGATSRHHSHGTTAAHI